MRGHRALFFSDVSIDKLDSSNCLYSIMSRIEQMELNLFEHGDSTKDIKQMSFAELFNWCNKADLIRQAQVDAYNKVK